MGGTNPVLFIFWAFLILVTIVFLGVVIRLLCRLIGSSRTTTDSGRTRGFFGRIVDLGQGFRLKVWRRVWSWPWTWYSALWIGVAFAIPYKVGCFVAEHPFSFCAIHILSILLSYLVFTGDAWKRVAQVLAITWIVINLGFATADNFLFDDPIFANYGREKWEDKIVSAVVAKLRLSGPEKIPDWFARQHPWMSMCLPNWWVVIWEYDTPRNKPPADDAKKLIATTGRVVSEPRHYTVHLPAKRWVDTGIVPKRSTLIEVEPPSALPMKDSEFLQALTKSGQKLRLRSRLGTGKPGDDRIRLLTDCGAEASRISFKRKGNPYGESFRVWANKPCKVVVHVYW